MVYTLKWAGIRCTRIYIEDKRATGRRTGLLQLFSPSSSCWSAFRHCDLITPCAGGRFRLPDYFLPSGFLKPAWLRPLNKIWTKLGLLMGRVVSPVITAVLFYLVVTPTGLLFRIFGKDPLRLAL